MSDRQQTDAHSLSPQTLSALISEIYDCALDPARWDQTLANLTDAFETQTAALSLTDFRQDRFLIFRTVGIVAADWQRPALSRCSRQPGFTSPGAIHFGRFRFLGDFQPSNQG
jgi:hypothetical protein